MTQGHQGSINTGDISGQGIVVGHGSSANVQITQASRDELAGLLKELREQVGAAKLPEGAKKILLEKAVPEMEEAVASEQPGGGLERGLERVNDQLEGVGVAAERVSGILETVKKIAFTAGLSLQVAAPFIAKLLLR